MTKKLKTARYKTLEDGSCFGEIPGLRGVWANADNVRDCAKELQEVSGDWILLQVRDRQKIPGFEIRIDRRELVSHG